MSGYFLKRDLGYKKLIMCNIIIFVQTSTFYSLNQSSGEINKLPAFLL